MSEYTPIDCERYSDYELAIMHRQRLRIRWRDADDVTHVEILLPRDLQTRHGEEFLIAENSAGKPLEIRLDRIAEAKRISEE